VPRHMHIWITILIVAAPIASLAQQVEHPEIIVRKYMDAWNNRDVDAIVSFFADGGEYIDVTNVNNGWAAPWRGRDAIREAVRDMYAGVPDLAFDVSFIRAASDYAVVEWTMKGTHSGDWETLPATHQTLAVPGVSVIQLVDGKISHQRDYWDGYLFSSQLGLLPGPSED